jgi:hypothetical protein
VLWDVLNVAAGGFLVNPPSTTLRQRIAAGLASVLRAGRFLPVLGSTCLVNVACATLIGIVGGVIVLKIVKHYLGGEFSDTDQYVTYTGNPSVLGPEFQILARAPVHEDPASLSMCNKVCQGFAAGTDVLMSSGYQDSHLVNMRWIMKRPGYALDRDYDQGGQSNMTWTGLPSDFVQGTYWVLHAQAVSDTAGVPSGAGTNTEPSVYNEGICQTGTIPSCTSLFTVFPFPYSSEYSCRRARGYFAGFSTAECAASPVPTGDENIQGLKVSAFASRQLWRQYGAPPPYCFIAQQGSCQPGENPDSGDLLGQLALQTSSPLSFVGVVVGGASSWARWATPAQVEKAMHPVRAAPTPPPEPVNATQTLNVPPKSGYGSSSSYSDVRTAVDKLGTDAAKWIAAQLPDSPYADPTGTPTSFTMPDCHGISVSECVDLINTTWVDNENDAPNVQTTTYPVGDPDVCGACVLTSDPAAGSVVGAPAPSTVTLTINPPTEALPFQLPELDDANETYTQYVTRLRALGYLGTITRVNLTEETMVEQLGPNVPAYVHVPAVGLQAPTTVPMAFPPATMPQVGVETPLTIDVNPTTAPPIGGTTGGGGPDECCPANALDFNPLLAISCVDKFPCGLFAYAAGVVAMFNVSPDAPHFEFENLAGTTTDYNVDLELLDPYAATIRTLLTFCMWIGAVWFIAARMLKIESAGDPGAAVDEAI